MTLFRSNTHDMGNAYYNLLHRFFRDEQGNFALTAALSSLVMLITVGASVDISLMHTKKAKMQSLIDHATLSAALAMNSENTSDSEIAYYKQMGEKAFTFDGHFDPSNIQSLTFVASNDGIEVTGSVTLDHFLFFGGILGSAHKEISAKSVVNVAAPEAAGNGCIIILENNSRGLLLNSGANIEAPDCEVSIHSMGNPAFISNNNVNLDVKKLCVAGSRFINNGGQLNNLETECEVMENPFEGAFSKPDLTCDYNNGNYNDSIITLDPGVYCGWHNFNNGNAQVTFNPGTYVLRNGGWNVNGGDWEAVGVTFYFADRSRIQFNSGVSANITAPTSGDYRGVAFFEPDGLSNSDFTLDDSRGLDVSGLIYLPSRNVTFNSGSNLTARDMSFIVNRLTVNNADLILDAETILSESGGGIGGTISQPYVSE